MRYRVAVVATAAVPPRYLNVPEKPGINLMRPVSLDSGVDQSMREYLGDVAYWTAFYGSAFLVAFAIWALMNRPINDPVQFGFNVGVGAGLVLLVGTLARRIP